MFLSIAWHALLINLTIPLGRLWQQAPPSRLAVPRIEVTWYGQARDFKPLAVPGPAVKPSPPGEPRKPLPPRGADAAHSRQTILSVPVKATHPRQTLIQPEAPPQAPKILPQLPNLVLWQEASRHRRLAMPVNPAALAQPRSSKSPQAAADPAPELPNQETNPGPLNIATSRVINPAPRMPINPSALSAPQVRRDNSQAAAAAAPDIEVAMGTSDTGLKHLIALSPSPGSDLAVPVPPGNVTAKFTVSPEGTQPGVPGVPSEGTLAATGGAKGGPGSIGGTGSIGGNGGEGPNGIAISSDSAGAGGGSGLAGAGPASAGGLRPAVPFAKPLPLKPEPRIAAVNPRRTQEQETATGPAAPPLAKQVLGTDRVYTLLVNMPNLTSVAGSWVLNFAEVDRPVARRTAEAVPPDLTGPMPLRKVDPKYPPELVSGHVEGEVVLYAIIRSDGSVDSMRVVKGVDPMLDRNAMEALGRWKFRPASRHGLAVDVAAVVTIPFRAVTPF